MTRWQDNPAVTATPGEHRSTDIGDVLIGRDGQSLEISGDDGLRLKPIAAIDRVNPHHQEANLGRTSAERGKESGAWPDDIEGTSLPPPSRAGVEEQIRRLTAGTEFTTIIERFDGPPENRFVDIRQEEKLIGRSWGELTEGQKLGQLQVATDVMLLNPQETRKLLAREVDFTRVTLAEQEAYLGRPFDGPSQPAPGQRDPVHRATDIRLEPGHGNPLSRRDDRSFDIHDATGKIGYLTGYLGGPGAMRTRIRNSA